MGLKFGFTELTSRIGLYFPITTKRGVEFSYARPFFFVEENEDKIVLRFLNGNLGYLVFNRNFQLEISTLETDIDWVPAKEEVDVMKNGVSLPKEMVIFGGNYLVSEVFPSRRTSAEDHRNNKLKLNGRPHKNDRRVSEILEDTTAPPPEEHTTVHKRFEKPVGVWNATVASYLKLGGAFKY